MRKKITSIILAFSISTLFMLMSCVKETPDAEIKLGAILPLSGDAASYGEALKTGMDLALDEINAEGIHGKKLNIIYEDSQGSPKNAIASFNKLAFTDKVQMIIGDMFSASTLAIAPIAEKQKVVLLSPTASAVELTRSGDYIFRIYPSDLYDGEYLASFSKNGLKAKTASIIYLQVTSISSISQIYKKRFEELGGNVLSLDSYKEGDTDFRSQLLKAKKVDADVIFIPGYLREMAMLLKQAKELGIKKKFISISTFFDPKILELAGNAANGVIFSAPVFDPDSTSSEIKHFVSLFESKQKYKPDILAGYGYDVLNIAARALKQTPSIKGESIKTSLYNIKYFPGVTGNSTFDANGDVIKELRMMTVSDGVFKAYE